MDCHGYWYRQLCSPEDGGGGVRMTLINPATFYPVPPTLQNLQRSNASVHNGRPEAASRQFVKELWSIALHVCTNVKCPFSQDSLHEMEMNTKVYKSWAIWQSSGILPISRIWGTSWQNFQPLLTIFIHKCCQRSSRMNPPLLFGPPLRSQHGITDYCIDQQSLGLQMSVNAQMLNPEVQISVPARYLTVDCTEMIKKKKKKMFLCRGPANLHIHAEHLSESRSVKPSSRSLSGLSQWLLDSIKHIPLEGG